MANIKANEKSMIRDRKLRIKHKSQKSYLRNRIKTAKTTGIRSDHSIAVKAIDSKAAKGLIKKRTANRLKSRLALHINKVNANKSQPVPDSLNQ